MSAARRGRPPACANARKGGRSEAQAAAAPVHVCDRCGFAVSAISAVAVDRYPDVDPQRVALSRVHAEINKVHNERLASLVVGTARVLEQRVSACVFGDGLESYDVRVDRLRRIRGRVSDAVTTLLAVEFELSVRLSCASSREGGSSEVQVAAAPVHVCVSCGFAVLAISVEAVNRYPDVDPHGVALSRIHAEINKVHNERLASLVVGTARVLEQRVSACAFGDGQDSYDVSVDRLRRFRGRVSDAVTSLLAVEFELSVRLGGLAALEEGTHIAMPSRRVRHQQ